ncbi:hypothetical protein LCGC14_3031990 [marine sediment metagenome]|uniref:Uncharacterized protein n=1 Tax=marine sediment metagenome TaxID=412755 RepID=A0A0F8WRW4_9ZZZZ
MKTIAFLAMAIVFWAMPVQAQSVLTSDPQAGVTGHIVVVSGVTDPLTYLANPDGSLNFPLAGFSPGPYTFVVYAIGNGGWRSGPSAPLDATKPASVLNVRIE